MTPATPAAACVWPRLDLTEPTHSGVARPVPYTAIRARASIGSPSRVPVPCASTRSTSCAATPDAASASASTRSCACPLGAVMPLDAPSELTAEPRMTASTGCPCRSASDSRSRKSIPAPSPSPKPSAPAPNALHRPSGASARCLLNSVKARVVASTVAPPASAATHSPARSARTARWSATSDDEHAVSIVADGPASPNV